MVGIHAAATSAADHLEPVSSAVEIVDSTRTSVAGTRSTLPTGSVVATTETVRPLLQPPSSSSSTTTTTNSPASVAFVDQVDVEEGPSENDDIRTDAEIDTDNNNDDRIRESVVISTSVDAEKEAQDLYDKALKQYDSYGASARNICAEWELRGCQCTVSMAELTLSCRNVGLEEVPLDLPVEIVKL